MCPKFGWEQHLEFFSLYNEQSLKRTTVYSYRFIITENILHFYTREDFIKNTFKLKKKNKCKKASY